MLFVRKARSFVRAMWSFIRWGDAPIGTHDDRMRACLSCPKMDFSRAGIFCASCGCPRWPLSDLRTKWRMRDARCPLNQW
jgi:hypothetical protein